MSRLEKNQLHTVTITGYSAEGMGITRVEQQVVFVHGAVRGETCVIRILKVLKNVAFARVEEIVERSENRVESDCPNFPACGGCDFRHLSYTEELEAKRMRVQDALQRIGGADIEVTEILGSEETTRYRNKSQFPISTAGKVGFYRARSHDVIPTTDCLLLPPQAGAIAKAVEEYMREFSVSAYDEKSGKGLLRHIYVRTNCEGAALVCLIANGKKLPHEDKLVERIRAACADTVGVVLNVNTKDTNVILGDHYRTLWGEDTLMDTLCGLSFRLSIPSFYQVNRPQAQRLYAKAVELAQLNGSETVLDLYCGAGTITLAMADKAGKVIGAEIVPEAIENAKENAARNGITNAEFFCGDVGDIAAKLAREKLRPDVVVVDPPRKGSSEDVIAAIAKMSPDRVVYVSCDCATLARDVKRFAEVGYEIKTATAVDMFPRTCHVETVALLSKLRWTQTPDSAAN